MPIIRIESSIPLPPQTSPAAALTAVGESVMRGLGSKPVQLRVEFVAVDQATVMVEGKVGSDAPPWICALAHIHEGRAGAERATFINDLMATIATCYGVSPRLVKVLVQDFTDTDWAFGRDPA
jgi:phenylpyruvate tautomerase PptA (4-oxalocrotonate tautomerase family)